MRRIVPLLLVASMATGLAATDYRLHIGGQVKSALTKGYLTNAKVVLFDSLGSPSDTCRANSGFRYNNRGEIDTMSYFGFYVPHRDSVYTMEVSCPGYETEIISFEVKNLGKREDHRTIPVIFMKRAAKTLGEVTVTASKIKFYNKGDTVVFNADAFQLAEGSMLDGLIAQLPGVELKEGGVIMFEGKQVESLLLNGRKFLDGNNQLMLENIGAYTVKNVEVYEGQTEYEKWLGDTLLPKHLTMDVKLKKEYNMGWTINAQAGGGTKDRYTGRLFASWFNNLSNVTVLANVNNLNDNRKPGKSDTWTPERLPSGRKEYRMGTINYDHKSADDKFSANGYFTCEETVNKISTNTNTANFLNGANNYQYSFSDSRTSDLKLDTRHYFRSYLERLSPGGMVLARYVRKNSMSNDASATFNEEQGEMTRQMLESIYGSGTPEQMSSIVNRSLTSTDGSRKTLDLQIFPYFTYKIPGSSDYVTFEPGLKYSGSKEERWKDYTINFGSNPEPSDRLRQYFDNSPNRSLNVGGYLGYTTHIRHLDLSITAAYDYRHQRRDRDSYMYALDRLSDMGIYGQLPAGYLDTFDPTNSYTSMQIENSHTVEFSFFYSKTFKSGSFINISFMPEFTITNAHLDYWRDGRSYFMKRHFYTAKTQRNGLRLDYGFGREESDSRRLYFKNMLTYSGNLTPKTPNLYDMIDVVNDADPLNISTGNPDLKVAYTQNHSLTWRFMPKKMQHPIRNSLSVSGSWENRSLTRGYTYDTSTGVRVYKTYNVNGNNSQSFQNDFSIQFGKRNQFMLGHRISGTLTDYADMIGTDVETPEQYRVGSNYLTQSVDLTWEYGKNSFNIMGEMTNRHTSSKRKDFRVINANHYKYGGRILLRPFKGFEIAADFIFYTRNGYGMKEIDKTTAVWNMRFAYTPSFDKRRWLFSIDGFDLLHQLTNYNYSVTATGRTVSFTNALPRYVLFSVQYRLNIMPKKR
jgi:hypothetical protein